MLVRFGIAMNKRVALVSKLRLEYLFRSCERAALTV
jgi:hypothetical protein